MTKPVLDRSMSWTKKLRRHSKRCFTLRCFFLTCLMAVFLSFLLDLRKAEQVTTRSSSSSSGFVRSVRLQLAPGEPDPIVYPEPEYHDNLRYSDLHALRLRQGKKSFPRPEFPYPVHFITYSDDAMRNSRERLCRQATRSLWFKTVKCYNPKDLPVGFEKQFEAVLNQKQKGGGYYVWRWPVLELAMDRVPMGEFIIFMDAGCALNTQWEAKEQLIRWIKMVDESPYDELAFELSNLTHNKFASERHRTTHKIFDAFNVPKDKFNKIRWTRQYAGGTLVMRNGRHLRKILAHIYNVLGRDPHIITDKYNVEARQVDPVFQNNRHDQSIHSIARKIHGAVVVPWPGDLEPSNPFHMWRIRNMTWDQVAEVERQMAASGDGKYNATPPIMYELKNN